MNEIVNTQTLLFIKAIEIGILLGMFYDLIRIFRKIIKHPNWMLQLEDALYWMICIAITFGILYVHNFAQLRFFVFVGMILGAILYLCTFSILFMKIATWLINLIQRFILWLVHLVLIPIRWLINLVKIPLHFLGRKWRELMGYRKKKSRQLRRAWYYKEADIRTSIKVKRNKNIYNPPKKD